MQTVYLTYNQTATTDFFPKQMMNTTTATPLFVGAPLGSIFSRRPRQAGLLYVAVCLLALVRILASGNIRSEHNAELFLRTRCVDERQRAAVVGTPPPDSRHKIQGWRYWVGGMHI